MLEPEFRRLLDEIDRVAAGSRERDYVCPGAVRLQDERRIVGVVDGNVDRPEDGPAARRDDRGAIAQHRLSESIIGRDKVPFLATMMDEVIADRVRGRPCIEGPLDRVGRAVFPGQIRRSRAGRDQPGPAAANDLVDGQADR